MTEITCHYPGDRDQAIVSYLYGDDVAFDRDERPAFEAHLATCGRCRAELSAFGDVRASLARWSPPFPGSPDRPGLGDRPAAPLASSSRSWWHEVPVWARTAAALVCLGAGAALANLDVRYDAEGLRVHTGWLNVPAAVAESGRVAPDAADPAWRAELAALEQRLRTDLAPAPVPAAAATADNPDLLRRVRALVDESERRQQRELALRVAEVVREAGVQRQADLARIDRSIGAIQNSTGREMLRQRSEMLNYVTVRTASQRPQ